MKTVSLKSALPQIPYEAKLDMTITLELYFVILECRHHIGMVIREER